MKILNTLKSFSVILCLATAGVALVTASGCSTGRPGETLSQDQGDRDITSRIEASLQATDYKFPDVKVETIKRTVELSGSVDTADHKDEAGRLAQQGVDVKEVINHITVK